MGIKNESFENWRNGMPDGWKKLHDTVGSKTNLVSVVKETSIKQTGSGSAFISASPGSGITQDVSINSKNVIPFSVLSAKGYVALHVAKENGTSAAFDTHKKLQDNFTLWNGIASTAIRNAMAVRLDNGDLIELFSASNSSETSGEGAVYAKRNGGDPYLFRNDSGLKNWTWAKVLDYGEKYTWINNRVNSVGECFMYLTDIDRTFTEQSNDRPLVRDLGYNSQAYNALIHSSGKTIIPFVYAESSKVSSGPWYLDLIVSDDNLQTWRRLNQPKTIAGRGIMEPHPVELSDGTVAILFRTSQDYLGRVDFHPTVEVMGEPYLTNISQPQSGVYATNLKNGKIALVWLTGTPNATGSSHPRKILAFAASNDNMNTWQDFHIVATSQAVNGDMTNDLPYIHQPYLFEDDDRVTIYFEDGISSSDVIAYKTECLHSKLILNNVTTKSKQWETISVNVEGLSSFNVQILGVLELKNDFYVDELPKIVRMKTEKTIENIPIYTLSEIANNRVRIYQNGEVKCFDLTEINSSDASSFRVMVNGKEKALKRL